MRPKKTVVHSGKNFTGIERVIGLQQNPVQDICSLNLTPHQGTFLFTCFCPSCHSKSQPHFVSMMEHLQKLITAVLGLFSRGKKGSVLFHGGFELNLALSECPEQTDEKVSLKAFQ